MPRSIGIYISQLIRFATVCSHVDNSSNRNKFLTYNVLKQGYGYHVNTINFVDC